MTSPQDGRGWQVGKSLSECLNYMMDYSVACDVTFLLPPNKKRSKKSSRTIMRIPAHKFMLMARSPVFEAMFTGAYLETSQDVEIPDMEVDVFKALLRYIYCEEAEINRNNVLPILFAAKKYIVHGLLVRCMEYLDSNLTEENACTLLTHSMALVETEVAEKSLHFMCCNPRRVLENPDFLNLSPPALHRFLEAPSFPADLEATLYRRSVDWAHAIGAETDEEVRERLGECLNHIRFLTMAAVDFTTLVGPHNVLNAEEKSLHLCYLTTGDQQYSQALAKVGFNTTSREHAVPRFQYTYAEERTAPCKGEAEIFTLSVDQPVCINGFTFFLGPKGAAYKTTIEITPTENPTKVECQSEVKLTSRGEPEQTVYLNEGARLRANVCYTVTVSLEGSESSGYGQSDKGSKGGAVCGVTFTMKTTQWPNAESRYHKGKVASVLFQRDY